MSEHNETAVQAGSESGQNSTVRGSPEAAAPRPSTAQVRQLIEDFAEVKKTLKSQSKNELIHSIVNLMHNQLALIDALEATQAQLKAALDAGLLMEKRMKQISELNSPANDGQKEA